MRHGPYFKSLLKRKPLVFMAEERNTFENILEKEEMLLTSIYPFPTNFSILPKAKFKLCVTLISPATGAFNLDVS